VPKRLQPLPPDQAAICPHCGSRDVVQDVPVVKSVETGWVGLHYKALGPLCGTEPLLADLCRDCGTVCRFHVRNPARTWLAASRPKPS
jgi:hypothetical protein